METLTILQAYRAMVDYLERFYQNTGSDDVATLLSGMLILSDHSTADQAAWEEWMESVNKILYVVK